MSAERPHRWRRWLIGVAIALLALIAIAIGALQYGLSRVPEYQQQLQALVRERTGLTIDFRRVDTSLRWYGPEVVFWGAVVRTPDDQVLASARRGAVSLAWGRSLLERRLVIGRISLDGPEIDVTRTVDGRFKILGFEPPPNDRGPDLSRLPEGAYRVRDARVRFIDEQHDRQPWVLSHVALDVRRKTDSLQVRGSTDLPQALGRDLRFEARISGDLKRAQTWQSEAQIDADSLQLARWRESVAPDLMDALQGVASLRVRTRWQGLTLQELKGNVQLRDLVASVPSWDIPIPDAAPLITKHANETAPVELPLTTKALPTRVAYDRLQANVELRRMRKEWRLQIDDLDLGNGDPAHRSSNVQASWTKSDGVIDSLWVKTNHIALDPLWPLLAWLPERDRFAHVRALEAGGAIDDVNLYYQRGANGPTYRVQAQLRDLRFAPVGKVPGLAGITARLDANEREGSLEFTQGPLEFAWPYSFRETLSLDRFAGKLRWRHDATGWILNSEGVELANSDGRAEPKLQLTFPRDGGTPRIELTAEAYDLDARATSRYLPANHLSDKTLDWLDHAFIAGRVPHASLHINGPLRGFPYRDGSGEFIARADVRDLTLDYQPDLWTPATQVQANVEFRNVGMRGELTAGRIGALELQHAEASFADFKDAVLVLKASARGDVEEALHYVQSSPIGPPIGSLFMGLNGHGAGEYSADLELPLKDLAARRVDVNAKVVNAWLDHPSIKEPVSHLSGSIRILDTQIHSGSFTGQWLGGPAIATIEPRGQSSTLTVQGTLRATELATLLRLPAGVRLAGDSAWSGNLQINPRSTNSPSTAHVTVDLDGASVALPVPLHKEANEHRPLAADLEWNDAGAYVRATFGPVRAIGRIAQSDRGWQFDRASVRADGAVPSLPAHTGVRLEGHVDTFILDDWLALQGPPGTSDAKSGFKVADVLRAANLDIDEFGLFGYRWQNVRGLLQAQDRSWRVDVTSPQVEGHLQVPYDFASGDALTADMEHLTLPERVTPDPAANGAPAETDPRKLPPLEAHVREFTYQDHGMGELTLELARVPQGVRIDKLQLRGASYEGNSSGTWLATPAGQQTTLDLLFVSTDVRDTLTALGYSPFMQSKHAELKGTLSWPGGMNDQWLAQASGNISVHIEQGQLLKVEPGAGRVLGLFSFSALPRRLSLDFTDLTGEGLGFDRIHGDFDIREGNAYTNNLLVTGPAAEIGLAGRTGLETHDYDQTVVVTGKLGASLPVAGALAAGPVGAAAVLLFSQIFKEPLKGVTRGYYRITGSWDEPEVERIHGAQAKEAAETSRNPPGAVPQAGAGT